MSYHLNFNADTKAAAKTEAATQFDQEVARQPVHAADKAAALANLSAALDLLPDGRPVSVSMNGWIENDDAGVASVAIGVQVTALPAPSED